MEGYEGYTLDKNAVWINAESSSALSKLRSIYTFVREVEGLQLLLGNKDLRNQKGSGHAMAKVYTFCSKLHRSEV